MPYSKAADCYSLGVILWELAGAAAPPWHGMSPSRVIATVAVERKSLQVPFGNDEAYAELIRNSIAFEPVKRPSAAEIEAQLKQIIKK